jgi:hypothetical protein
MHVTALKKKLRTALRRRFVLALVVGGVAFTTVYAFAATLGVSSQSLGAGNAAVTTCAASVTATYAIAYDSTVPGYKVSSVTLNNLTACNGKTITVDLTKADNSSIGQVTGTVLPADATAGTKTIALPASPVVSAALVTGVAVAIAG